MDFMRYVLKIKGDWKDLKGKLKLRYSNLTDQDLESIEGNHENIMNTLEAKLGKTRQELVRILNSL